MRPPTPPPIALRTALASDLPHLTRLDLAANASHPLISLSPFTYPFQATKLFLAHLKHCFARPRTYGFLVATTTTTQQQQLSCSPDSGIDVFASEEREAAGEVVGFLVWKGNAVDGEAGSGSGEEEEEEEEEWDWEARLPAGSDRKLWRRYATVMGTGAEGGGGGDESSAVIGIEKFAVAPRYQRQGIGTLLLQAFLDDLGDRGRGDATICMRSSVKGRKLYEKFGWVVEREYRMDLGDWGRYHQAHVEFAMRRGGVGV